MGYQNQQQPYMGQSPMPTGLRYGNYNGARFPNMGVGNSNRYGTQFKPGQPGGRAGMTPMQSQPFGSSPMQPPLTSHPYGMPYSPPASAPQQNPLQAGNTFGPTPPSFPNYGAGQMQNGQPTASINGYQLAPSTMAFFGGAAGSPNSGYTFDDQAEQYRRMYGF